MFSSNKRVRADLYERSAVSSASEKDAYISEEIGNAWSSLGKLSHPPPPGLCFNKGIFQEGEWNPDLRSRFHLDLRLKDMEKSNIGWPWE